MSDEAQAGGALRAIVSRAHQRLDDLFRDVEASFAELRDPDSVRDAFAALSEQLDVHFEQEDRLYYAPIGTLRPELAPQIRAISDSHRSFRLEIAAIRDELERGDRTAARRRLAAFAEGFARHEALEESLLQRLDAGIPPAPPV